MRWRTLYLLATAPPAHRCTRWLFVGTALALWLTFLGLVFIRSPQDGGSKSCSDSPRAQEPATESAGSPRRLAHLCDQLNDQLDQIRVELLSLQEENRQLKRLAESRDFRPVQLDGQFQIQRVPQEGRSEALVGPDPDLRRVDPLRVAAERRLEGQLYSKEHELERRELRRNIWELFLRLDSEQIRARLSAGSDKGREQRRLNDQLEYLLLQLRAFSLVDQAGEWHKRALDRLGERIQSTLLRLQYPDDCAQSRLLICDLNKGCGFGCQLHHVTYCLIVASASNRTLVLERDGAEWRYSDRGWNAVYESVGKCTFAQHVPSSGAGIEPFAGIGQQARVVRLPIVDGLQHPARPAQLPLAFPLQFADLLLTHHSHPPAYFVAQFLAFLMRENANTKAFVAAAEKKVPFDLGPVVGLQIRRTDKVGTEAAFHSLDEYMRWAELWFRVEQRRMGIPLAKRVFIATDDKSVIDEARDRYGPKGFYVFANDETAEAAQPGSRYTDRSLMGVIADVRLLSRCSYIVCTFSSQVCRLGYELMQVLQGDAAEQVHSLDDIFYFGGQHAHEWEAIGDFHAESEDEMDLLKGDTIGIAGNHWNGFSKGTNRRTQQTGLFPSHLAREKWRIVDFPIFDN